MRILVVAILLLALSLPAFAAWEWQDRSAVEWAMRIPFYPEPIFCDSSGWKVLATVTHPYGLTDITSGHIRGIVHYQHWLARGELAQLGAEGYRETSLRLYAGRKIGEFAILGGVLVGTVDVLPLSMRVREAVGVEASYYGPLFTIAVRGELPIQNESDPVAIPQQQSAVLMLDPVKTVRIGIGYEHTNHSDNLFSLGGAWTPLRELTLRIGVDPHHGWGGGVTVRYRQFAFSFASFSVEPLGWSSLWSAQAGSQVQQQPGYRYPVTLP